MERKKYWQGTIRKVDDFDDPITTEFIDGKTIEGPWAIMTPKTYKSKGIGRLGLGLGQRYVKQEDGRFQKVEG